MSERQPRSLIVTACSKVFTGTSKTNNKEFSIYEVMATQADGTPLDLPFRAFEDLTPNIGKAAEYDVTPYDRDGHDRTYTLKAKDRPKLTPRVEELERRVQALEQRLDFHLQGGSSQSQSQPTAEPLVPADEDIPF